MVRKIVWRIYDLGYTLERFGNVSAQIAAATYHWADKPPSERYGKKYARIAYQEQYGLREDAGLHRRWRNELLKPAECDIDPSFPDSPVKLRILPDLLGDRAESTQVWVNNSSGERATSQMGSFMSLRGAIEPGSCLTATVVSRTRKRNEWPSCASKLS